MTPERTLGGGARETFFVSASRQLECPSAKLFEVGDCWSGKLNGPRHAAKPGVGRPLALEEKLAMLIMG